MNLWTILKNTVEGKAWKPYVDSTFRISEYQRTSSLDPASLKMLAVANGQAMRCAWLNATVAASCTPRLFRKKNARGRKIGGVPVDRKTMAYLRGDAGLVVPSNVKDLLRDDDAVEIVDSEIVGLLRKPNPYQTGMQWRLRKFYYMQIAGDYWANLVTDSPDGAPLALAPMDPQYVTVEIGPDGLPRAILYAKDGAKSVATRFDPAECVSWQFRPSRVSLYRGEGWLVNAYRECGLLERALVAQEASWENMQRPDWVFMLPVEATQDHVNDARKAIESRHRGIRNAGKPFVARGANVETLNWSPKDSMFDTQISTMMKVIRNAAGIPEALQDMNSATFENAAASVTTHRRDTILPMLISDAEQDTENLLPKLGIEGDYFIAYTDVVPEDETRRAAMANAMYSTGAATINEIRATLGLDPVEWGTTPPAPQMYRQPVTTPNELRIGMDLKPVEGGDAIATGGLMGGGQPPAAEPDKGGDKPKPDPEMDMEDDAEKKRLHAKRPEFFKIPDRYAPVDCHCKCKKAAPDPLSEAGIQRFADSVELWVRRAAETFGVDSNGFVKLPPGAAAELARLLEKPMDGVTAAAVDRATEIIPDRVDAINVEQLQRFNDSYRVQLARDITANLESELTEAIKAGAEQGLGVAETTQRIKEILPDEAGWRALRIANTETARVNQETDIEVWKQVGIKQKTWLLAPDACSVCQAFVAQYANMGQPMPIETVYAPAGTVITGADGKSYTTYRNVVSGPLHPNDRCSVNSAGEIEL